VKIIEMGVLNYWDC